jgi:methylated-DNA-protein-cysteine methyltransferase-like protein
MSREEILVNSRTKKIPRGKRFGQRVHGDIQRDGGGAYDQVYAVVREIPSGRVMTYGQIATVIENRLSARAVGWALHGCPEDVPWQRVVNASGICSTDRLPDIPEGLQRAMLEGEGVEFRDNGSLALERYRWLPD